MKAPLTHIPLRFLIPQRPSLPIRLFFLSDALLHAAPLIRVNPLTQSSLASLPLQTATSISLQCLMMHDHRQ
jgi:hypothetical protein